MTRQLLASTLLLCAAPALIIADPVAAAAVSPPGVNLRWDQCYGDGGVSNKTFACDTNTGSERIVASFELAAPMPTVSGTEFIIDIGTASPTMPTWWQFRSAGSCRQASLQLSLIPPPGAASCVDWASGTASGGIGAYNVGLHGPNAARMIGAIAVPPSGLVALDPGIEYLLGSFTINHAKTVGPGACTGCDAPVCIFLSRVMVTTPVLANNTQLNYGANYSGSQYVTWQNGYPTNVAVVCDTPILFCNLKYVSFTCVPYSTTQARGSTWGAVKSLYR